MNINFKYLRLIKIKVLTRGLCSASNRHEVLTREALSNSLMVRKENTCSMADMRVAKSVAKLVGMGRPGAADVMGSAADAFRSAGRALSGGSVAGGRCGPRGTTTNCRPSSTASPCMASPPPLEGFCFVLGTF